MKLLQMTLNSDNKDKKIKFFTDFCNVWTNILFEKGFPHDAQLDQIQECLRKYGNLDQVLMRRVKNVDRIFKACKNKILLFEFWICKKSYACTFRGPFL